MPVRALSSRALQRAAEGLAAQPLPLRMPAPSPLPGNIRPEASVPCIEPFDDPAWRFSVDWDGCRALLFADEDGVVRLQGETLTDLTKRFPELAAAGGGLTRLPAVLDGVIAVLDPEGRPDVAAIASRALPGSSAWRLRPAVFLATDLLHLGGSQTMSWPLERRLEALTHLAGDGVSIQAPDYVEGRGVALADAAEQRGLTALLARRSRSVYHCGVASPDRLRILLENRVTCVVAGYEPGGRPAGTLVLAEFEAGRLVPAGRVPAPSDRASLAWLRRALPALRTQTPPLQGIGAANVTWLRPHLTATADYSARTGDGLLRSPTLVAIRDDVDPMWCVRREPVVPPHAGTGVFRFNPTVLEPLPLDVSPLPLRAGG